MALIYTEGFAFAIGDWPYRFTTASTTGQSISTSYGRNGGYGTRHTSTGYLTRNLGDLYQEFYMGFAIKMEQLAIDGTDKLHGIITLENSSGVQISLRPNEGDSGSLDLKYNESTYATTSGVLTTWTWVYVEFYCYIANSPNGRMVVKFDGSTVMDYTGDTWYNGEQGIRLIRLGGGGGGGGPDYQMCDVYVCDPTGEDNNTFLGDISVLTLHPDGAGNYSQWTPNTGTNYECVDELDIDGDTTYVEAKDTGYKDSYTLDNLSVDKSILGIEVQSALRKPYGGSNRIRQFVRVNSGDYKKASKNIGTAYQFYSEVFERNPDTGDLWTKSEIDSLEAGVEIAGLTTTTTTSTTTT